MTSRFLRRDAPQSILVLVIILIPLVVTACSSGGDQACMTCPTPTDSALRVNLAFDDLARGLDPSAFRIHDLSRIELVVEGGTDGMKTLQLTPPQSAAFINVHAGTFAISATGYLGTDLVLFTAGPQTVAVVKGDTVDVQLEMIAALGDVVLEVGGKQSGAVQAVAGQDIPFVVSVENTQGRPVPGAAIVVTSSAAFGGVLFTGTNDTDAEGRVHGIVRAPHRGIMGGFAVTVDGRPVPVPGDMRVEFASAVAAARSNILTVTKETLIPADGSDGTQFTILVQDVGGNPLPGVPVFATSSRNAGVDKNVDVFVPLPGYESGKTDNFGRFALSIRSTTSSFMELDAQGRLFSRSDSGRAFHPATIRVMADSIQIDQRDITFTPVTNPTGAMVAAVPQAVPVGQSTTIVVRVSELPQFGGGPAIGAFVEITNTFHESQNYIWNLQPAAGFSGFRTNAQGEWRGILRRSVPGVVSLEAKADGRALTHPVTNVIFQ